MERVFSQGEQLIIAGMATLIDEGKTAREVLHDVQELAKDCYFGLVTMEKEGK